MTKEELREQNLNFVITRCKKELEKTDTQPHVVNQYLQLILQTERQKLENSNFVH